jgi:hypothetical protein
MITTNTLPATSSTDSATLVSAEKVPDKTDAPKVAVIKRRATKRTVPVATVERGTTQRRRATGKPSKAVSPNQPLPGKPKSKNPPVKNAGTPIHAVPSSKPVVAPGRATPKKVDKLKVVRDSVTMPLEDYERIGALKKHCLTLGIAIKKSELLRAGLATLQRLSNEDLKRVLALVEKIKTGRPVGDKKTNKPGKKHRK